MRTLPFWFICLATLFALTGMAFGIYMAITQDHSLAPAHAHHNLIGWVSMALYGFYYKAVPIAAKSRLALIHFWVALIGALLFGPGIAMALAGKGEMLAQISSLLVIASMLVFAFIVWTHKAGLTVD